MPFSNAFAGRCGCGAAVPASAGTLYKEGRGFRIACADCTPFASSPYRFQISVTQYRDGGPAEGKTVPWPTRYVTKTQAVESMARLRDGAYADFAAPGDCLQLDLLDTFTGTTAPVMDVPIIAIPGGKP